MYAFFLLALLADLARAQVPASFGGDSAAEFAGGSVHSVARQIGVGPVLRRADRLVLTAAKSKAASFALSGWARILSAQARQSTPVMLAALSFNAEVGLRDAIPLDSGEAAQARCIFVHSGSPAP